MDPKRPTAHKPTGSAKPGPKPPAGKAKPAKPGDGFLGWFGRQVGHVSKAVKTDVTKPPAKKPAGSSGGGGAAKSARKPVNPPPKSKPAPAAAATTTSSVERVLYREDKVEEAALPDRPGVILRRTIIDEVVVETETTVNDPKPGAASRKPE
ncbi:MAG TPA: hypothetical protein VF796_10990 [Humisphaera sp.]